MIKKEPPQKPGHAETRVRRFFLSAAAVLLILSASALLVPKTVPITEQIAGSISWRSTAIAGLMLICLLLWNTKGLIISFIVGLIALNLLILFAGQITIIEVSSFSQTVLVSLIVGFMGSVVLQLSRTLDVASLKSQSATADAAAVAGANAARARAAALVHDGVLAVLGVTASKHFADQTAIKLEAAKALESLASVTDSNITTNININYDGLPREDAFFVSLEKKINELSEAIEVEAIEVVAPEATSDLHTVPYEVLHAIQAATLHAIKNSLEYAGKAAVRRVEAYWV